MKLLDVIDVSKMLNVHPETVRKWVRDGILYDPRIPGTRKMRWRADQFDAWLQSKTRPATPDATQLT